MNTIPYEVSERHDLKRKKRRIPANPAKQLLAYRRKQYKRALHAKKTRVKQERISASGVLYATY